MQILFQDDLNPCDPPSCADPFLQQRLREDDLLQFSKELIEGVRQQRQHLDEILEPLAEHWSVSRMATADRNILRLAAFEMLFLNTAHRIAIDEAIELGKRFGSAQSSQFVNGVLDRVWREHGNEGKMQTNSQKQDHGHSSEEETPTGSDRSI